MKIAIPHPELEIVRAALNQTVKKVVSAEGIEPSTY
jgi:hypothetical protein